MQCEGKSTLLTHLSRQPGVVTLPEPVHRWQNVSIMQIYKNKLLLKVYEMTGFWINSNPHFLVYFLITSPF